MGRALISALPNCRSRLLPILEYGVHRYPQIRVVRVFRARTDPIIHRSMKNFGKRRTKKIGGLRELTSFFFKEFYMAKPAWSFLISLFPLFLILFFLFSFFARTCLKRKSEKTKIARPKINKQKCPPCGRTSNYRKSWAPRPQQLETPRLQKKSLSPTLVQPTSWLWHFSCIRACAKLRNTRGVFFACFVADCEALLFTDPCSWLLDQLSMEQCTIDCLFCRPKKDQRLTNSSPLLQASVFLLHPTDSMTASKERKRRTESMR